MHPDILRYSSSSSPNIWQLKDALFFPDDDIQDVADQMSKLWIQAVCEKDSNYPSKLCRIKSQPYILYYQWDLSLLDKPILGVVWPRQPSIYAGKILDRLFKTADRYNIVTVSGMAPGVDQLAHRLSMEKGIPTIAVLWWGLGRFLQRPERHLIASIVQHGGLVISEFRLFQQPETYTFPQRNRIIAWLSDALFLPEASKKSGSLITVDFAHQMGISIYGTPYDIYSPQSQWLHEQMQLGIIKPIFDFKSLLTQYFSVKKQASKSNLPAQNLSESESKILSYLHKSQVCSLEFLSDAMQTSPLSLLSTISLLEIKQLIIQDMPGMYRVF